MHIFLDAMGGDHAPNAAVEGAIEALSLDKDLTITLAGDEKKIEALLVETATEIKKRMIILPTEDEITNHDAPVMAVRRKTKSAIVQGMMQLKEGKVDAFVSAGSTGAVLAGGMFRLGRIEGIERPALAPLLPNGEGYFLLIDCGANVDSQAEWLVQFGLMGSAYMKGVMGIDTPRVGLVNIGDEAEKGNALVKETYPLMEKAPYHFVGNIEARYITHNQADVLVADGFSGNLILKFMEGMAETLLGIIKAELFADMRGKIGGLIAKPAFKRVGKKMDYTEVGGAPLLGVKGPVIKAHGSSNGHAIACAIKQAMNMVAGKVVPMIEEELGKISN